MAGNVVSAAVISGELIIGLDDGSIIRAGYVQGPQGLKGDQGPMGATGSPGIDGNTIDVIACHSGTCRSGSLAADVETHMGRPTKGCEGKVSVRNDGHTQTLNGKGSTLFHGSD